MPAIRFKLNFIKKIETQMQEGWTELHAFGTQLRAIPLRLLLFIKLFFAFNFLQYRLIFKDFTLSLDLSLEGRSK